MTTFSTHSADLSWRQWTNLSCMSKIVFEKIPIVFSDLMQEGFISVHLHLSCESLCVVLYDGRENLCNDQDDVECDYHYGVLCPTDPCQVKAFYGCDGSPP